MADGKLAFGPFMLDAARGALLRDGAPVALGQRALAVLAALGETPGRTVAKEDLLARAWPGTIVEEGNLTVQIAALRKALGPGPDGRDWIVTVPRVGYRLVRDDGSAPADAGTEPPGLAVLPFQVQGGATGDAYFADGVTEDIITALGRFRSVTVLAAVSLALRDRPAHEVAQELGARYVLRGSLRRAGERLRITAELVDAVAGTHLWAQTFEGTAGDVFEFQDRITESVATAIEPQIRRPSSGASAASGRGAPQLTTSSCRRAPSCSTLPSSRTPSSTV